MHIADVQGSSVHMAPHCMLYAFLQYGAWVTSKKPPCLHKAYAYTPHVVIRVAGGQGCYGRCNE